MSADVFVPVLSSEAPLAFKNDCSVSEARVHGISNEAEGMIAQGPKSAGLKATGLSGVVAEGNLFGINASGTSDVAGYFRRLYVKDNPRVAALPQVRMEPHPMWAGDPIAITAVTALPETSADQLPMDGQAGDFLVTIRTRGSDSTEVNPRGGVSLWLCDVSEALAAPLRYGRRCCSGHQLPDESRKVPSRVIQSDCRV
jgi:hypothetical protein